VANGQGGHLAREDFRAFGCQGVVFGDVGQEPVQAPDAGLSDSEVAQGGQHRDASAGLVSLDGLWCDPFLGGDLFDPQVGEFADAGLPGDFVVVGGGAVT